MQVCLSSAHSLHVRGARGPSPWGLDEVDESRRVVDRVAQLLRSSGHTIHTFHDSQSKNVSTNLTTIVNWHNARDRQRDVSCHFNSFQPTDNARGVEVLHRSQQSLAAEVSRAMANAGGFVNRGAKLRTDLAFLNRVARPAILLEVCFVDSRADVESFNRNFDRLCRSIAEAITGLKLEAPTPPPPTVQPSQRPTIREGATGEAVRDAQRLLNTFEPTFLDRLMVDGVFGPVTGRRVREFQGSNQLVADGIVGPRTWAALEPQAVARAAPQQADVTQVEAEAEQVDEDVQPSSMNIIDLAIEPKGHERVIINGAQINETNSRNRIEMVMDAPLGDVILNINGEDFHCPQPERTPSWLERMLGRI